MEGSEVLGKDMVEQDEAEKGEKSEERTFKVGELVEFWEDSFVRGYRTEGGEPAWVKVDYGAGEYGIKMVINTRGKLRRVKWQRLFRDGSFNKLKLSETTGRVKSSERMREIEQDKAEAKFAVQIRQTKQVLLQVEDDMKRKEKEADERLKKQEMQARKDQKYLSAGHKRQLQQLREDMQTTRDKDMKARDEAYRQVRHKGRGVVIELGKTIMDLCTVREENNELVKAVTKGRVRVEGLKKVGLAWQGKHDELQGMMKGNGERLTCVEGSLVVQSREIVALKKKQDHLALTLGERDNVIAAHASILGQMKGKQRDKKLSGRREVVRAQAAEEVRSMLRGQTIQDKTRQDKTRQDKTRQDKTRQDKTRQDKTRQNKTAQDKTRADKTRLQ